MSIRHHVNTPIKIALLAATLTAAALLAIASREPPPLVTYTTPGGRVLNCDRLHSYAGRL